MTRVTMLHESIYTKIKRVTLLGMAAAVVFSMSALVSAAELSYPLTLPLLHKNDFEYTGAFRVPAHTYGESAAAYTEGPITLGADGKSFYLVGRIAHQAIAEFLIPELVKSTNLTDLNMATVIQPFSKVLDDRPATGNPQGMDRIGGMEYVDGELIVNTYVYYDSTVKTMHTTLVVKDAANLAGSAVGGYYGYEARAHASGWISPIPQVLQGILGGTHIAGNSNISPIISRYSAGPTAFAINPRQYILGNNTASTIPTSTLLDFSLENPLGDSEKQGDRYLDNVDHLNDLWTRISGAVYGFIVPGTRTYATIGYSGGHVGGVGYKIIQDNGNLCGGPCSNLAADNYNFYWLWDLNDLIAVKRGEKLSYEIMPYSYGVFDAPFQPPSGANKIVGGAFESTEHVLYLVIENGDLEQNKYEPLPVIVAYRIPALIPELPMPNPLRFIYWNRF